LNFKNIFFYDNHVTVLGLRKVALICIISAFLLIIPSVAQVEGYKIVILDPLIGADEYNTITDTTGGDDAIYVRWTTLPVTENVPPKIDFTKKPTLLSDPTHPIFGRSGKIGHIEVSTTSNRLATLQGCLFAIPFIGLCSLGRGTQFLNIGGKFIIMPEDGEAGKGTTVIFLAKGYIDGRLKAAIAKFADPPSASYKGEIGIQHIGTVTAANAVDGSISVVTGVKGTAALVPTAEFQSGTSTQLSKKGIGPVNFAILGKAPVDETIRWNFIFNMDAQNTNFLRSQSAASSTLVKMYLDLIPPTKQHPLDKIDPSFFSDSLFSFDKDTLELKIIHPYSIIEEFELGSIREEDDTLGPIDTEDFSNFKPETEFIIDREERWINFIKWMLFCWRN